MEKKYFFEESLIVCDALSYIKLLTFFKVVQITSLEDHSTYAHFVHLLIHSFS